jgi:hypothetical protein
MPPLLGMLEVEGLSLADAEAVGFHWLKWHGRYGRPPLCPNTVYFDSLKERK